MSSSPGRASPISSAGLTDSVWEDASSHSGQEPKDDLAQFLSRARREEENNRPAKWFNPDQSPEDNAKQENMHEEALQSFCADVYTNKLDPDIWDWDNRRDEVRYVIFRDVWKAVYEKRKDIPLVEESRGKIIIAYYEELARVVDLNDDREPDQSMLLENVPGMTPDRGPTPDYDMRSRNGSSRGPSPRDSPRASPRIRAELRVRAMTPDWEMSSQNGSSRGGSPLMAPELRVNGIDN